MGLMTHSHVYMTDIDRDRHKISKTKQDAWFSKLQKDRTVIH